MKKNIFYITIFLVLIILFFSKIIFLDRVFSFSDLSNYFYPFKYFAASEIKSGQIPLWNSNIYSGAPFLANFQSQVFYPLSVIYYILPFSLGFNYFIIFHVFLAGLFLFFLLKEWKLEAYAACFGAITFAFSGYIQSTISATTSLCSAAWLPLVLLFFERLIKTKNIKYFALLAFAFAFEILGGEPTIPYITLWILSARAVFFSAVYRENPIKKIFLVLIITSAAACLTMFQLLPFIELVKFSERSTGLPYELSASFSLPFRNLIDIVIPFIFHNFHLKMEQWPAQRWLNTFYMGIIPLFMMVFSFKIKDKNKAFFLWLSVISLILALGKNTPVYYIIYKIIPGISFVRFPVKFMCFFTFGFAILSAYGVNRFMEIRISKNTIIKIILPIILCALIILLFLYFFQNSLLKILINHSTSIKTSDDVVKLAEKYCNFRERFSWAFIFSSIAFILIFLKSMNVNRNIVQNGILVFAAIDLFFMNPVPYHSIESKYFTSSKNSNIEFFQQDHGIYRIFLPPDTEATIGIIYALDYTDMRYKAKKVLYPDEGIIYGISYVNGYDSIERADYNNLLNEIKKGFSEKSRLLDLVNAKYLISFQNLPKPYFTLVHEDYAKIYRNNRVLPRAFLVHNVLVNKNRENILEFVNSADFDPLKIVVLEEKPEFDSYGKSYDTDSANITSYNSRKVMIETNSQSSAVLFLSDTFYPGWKAYVDGKPQKIHRANYVFRAVSLGPGRHEIVFIYKPLSFYIGLVVTLIMITLMILLLCYGKKGLLIVK